MEWYSSDKHDKMAQFTGMGERFQQCITRREDTILRYLLNKGVKLLEIHCWIKAQHVDTYMGPTQVHKYDAATTRVKVTEYGVSPRHPSERVACAEISQKHYAIIILELRVLKSYLSKGSAASSAYKATEGSVETSYLPESARLLESCKIRPHKANAPLLTAEELKFEYVPYLRHGANGLSEVLFSLLGAVSGARSKIVTWSTSRRARDQNTFFLLHGIHALFRSLYYSSQSKC